MTWIDIWGPYGGEYRRCEPKARKYHLPLDPIEFAFLLALAQVLAGMRKCTWLCTAISIVRDETAFMLHVKPRQTAPSTVQRSWLPQLRDLVEASVLKVASKVHMAYGRFFVVAKGATGLGRAIFDMSIFSRACARPYPVNLPNIPSLLTFIGSMKQEEGWVWTADFRHWFYQIPLIGSVSQWFCIQVGGKCKKPCKCKGACTGKGECFQAQVLPMGWSWSPFIAQSIAWGIVLGEMPSKLAQYIDWDILKGDTHPAWVPLRKDGVDIGVIVIWYDNILVLCNDKEIVEALRKHIMERAKKANAAFKCERNEDGSWKTVDAKGEPEPEPVGQEAEFIGVTLKVMSGKWHWRHKDTTEWDEKIPTCAPRRDFASSVGILVWDATVYLETMEKIDPAMNVLRRITAGVKTRDAWEEAVFISEVEAATISQLVKRAKTREWTGIKDSPGGTGEKRGCVFVAADASKDRVAWVEVRKGDGVDARGINFDFADADPKVHIFYKELEAAAWALEIMCTRHTNVCIVLATDNSAVFHVLRRMFSGVHGAQVWIEKIKGVLAASGNTFLPVLVPGIQNVADAPTRDRDLEDDRMAWTWGHLNAAVNGGPKHLSGWSIKRPRTEEERVVIEEAPQEVVDDIDAFDHRDMDD